MPEWIAFIGRWTTATLFSVVGVVASTKPEDATSNVGAWWQHLTTMPAPVWLQEPGADRVTFWIGVGGALIAAFVAAKRGHSQRRTKVKPTSADQIHDSNPTHVVTSYAQSGGITAHSIISNRTVKG